MQALAYADIRARFALMRRDGKARHRDIADALGISEGELVAAHAGIGGPAAELVMHAVHLRDTWPDLIESLEPLGELMALTRNASCVHEKTGVYRNASHSGQIGLVLAGAIDLRVFYSRWAHGFAVTDMTGTTVQHSLQFFDARGTAVHKIFLRSHSNSAAWALLVDRFAAAGQQAGIAVDDSSSSAAERPDTEIDAAGLRSAWSALRDTHEFFGMLERFGVTRTQALRLAAPEFAQRVDAASAHQLLCAAARDGVPIMVFVGNPGVIQIHSGPVRKVAVIGPWLNVLDDGFNLHLREDHVASAWVVSKLTVDGLVTSLELFDAAGETIAMLFGERKPGRPELCEWRRMVADLMHEGVPCAA